eukprot:879436_1
MIASSKPIPLPHMLISRKFMDPDNDIEMTVDSQQQSMSMGINQQMMQEVYEDYDVDVDVDVMQDESSGYTLHPPFPKRVTFALQKKRRNDTFDWSEEPRKKWRKIDKQYAITNVDIIENKMECKVEHKMVHKVHKDSHHRKRSRSKSSKSSHSSYHSYGSKSRARNAPSKYHRRTSKKKRQNTDKPYRFRYTNKQGSIVTVFQPILSLRNLSKGRNKLNRSITGRGRWNQK